ncbi:hypothetical protein Bpfe_012449 [Biomphalaria pfeifferi]|uniref:Uncharacterized protein n=1 Tax=Biomphalaria pfeifferi TaxID=112525 RepID=A0AAD8BQQ2_BIOPF|nr:hypothetical protein Bpfe_012449 [Biomphalaria pfeifferi]
MTLAGISLLLNVRVAEAAGKEEDRKMRTRDGESEVMVGLEEAPEQISKFFASAAARALNMSTCLLLLGRGESGITTGHKSLNSLLISPFSL